MELGTVLHKTERGRAEVAHRSEALTAVQRRLLILVDGQRTLHALSAFVRVGELEDAVTALLGAGLVESETLAVQPVPAPVAPGFSPSEQAAPARAATDLGAFLQVQADAADAVQTLLGDEAQPLRQAILRCQNPAELRKTLRGIEIFVGERLDTATTQALARRFGSLLV